ncbi:MAG: 5'-nucleotidase C-terminal domain-containing protein [Candidatus Gastranaerophilaceae bacterium]|nr:5'-nucleotidase C-terminal domain-containing protein [Candidatus Gastranaerophilaceae bacterium]
MITKISALKLNTYKPVFGKVENNSEANVSNHKPEETEPKELAKVNPETIKASILAINDVHGKMTNMERIYAVSKQFDRTISDDCDKFKLASGDIILGANYTSNQVANKFLNWIGVSENALGNHELDVIPERLSELMNTANYKLLAINANVDPDSPMAGKIGKSVIEERNGHKYGIIGIAPSDMNERVKLNDSVKDIKIDDFDTTLNKVQDEVNRLRNEEGINKIIVLSHSGLKNDKKLAQNTTGIDIINSAHTHELVKDLENGVNILYSKSGEPVILTEYGKDGENVGILNVEFNNDGVITKAQNNVVKTRDFNRTLSARAAVESIIGKPEIIGHVSKAVKPPKERLIQNNPHGGIIVDAMKNELGTDIAILNAGNLRGHFSEGPVDSRLINDITPFEDKIWIGKLSEKDIVDAIKVGGKSFKHSTHKPGILMISGMKYTMTDNGELKSLKFIDKDGKEHDIDVNNPSTERKFTAAMDDFFATGGDNYLPTNENPDFVIQKLNFDKNKLACDYIRKFDKPFEVAENDKVTIIPAENKN